MRINRSIRSVVARGGLAAVVGLAAFSGSAFASRIASAAGGTVKISEGNVSVTIPTGHMKIGIFTNAEDNQWQEQWIKGAQAAARKAGDQTTVLNANFDVTTQLDQIVNAATNHSFNAATVDPIDPQAICNALTKNLAQANILISVTANPICGHAGAATLPAMYKSGTLNYVGGDSNYPYVKAFIRDAGTLNPGKQTVLAVVGPTTGAATIAEKEAFGQWEASHPSFHIAGYLYTDYTTPTAYTDTLNYLKANPKTTLILSIYSPDMTKGVLQAMQALGDLKKIKVDDEGGSSYSVQEVKQGNLQFTLPYFPYDIGYDSVESLIAAQKGGTQPRYISDVPAQYGTVYNPIVITKKNASSFHPQY